MTISGTVSILGAGPRAAHAQVLPLRLKVGILQLSDGGAKDIAGTPLYAAEADVTLPSLLGSAGGLTLTAGIQDRGSGGTNLRVIPLTISKMSNLPNPASMVTGTVYYGLGLGAYAMHAEKDDFSKNETSFGGFGVVGYEMPVTGIFVEAKYQLVGSEVMGARPDGLLLMVGKHF